MKVLKFGGTSVRNADRISNVIEIIKSANKTDYVAVVVSAFGGVTDRLIHTSELAQKGDETYPDVLKELEDLHHTTAKALIDAALFNEIESKLKARFRDLADVLHGIFLLRELSLRSLDMIMSFGERLSAFIISAALKSQGVKAEFLKASNIIKSDDNFGNARVNFTETNANIRNYFDEHRDIQVITGFIAATDKNEITTLGRSGSDYTAAIFGAALDATAIEIWTDVDGVMTADPRKVPTAFSIASMTYEEAMEMSHFGSKVIHPHTMQPALEKNIPLIIKNTFNPTFPGTIIGDVSIASDYIIKGISSIHEIALLRVQGSGMLGVTGISARLFGALARANISVILITQGSSEHSICFAVAPKAANAAKKVIENEFAAEIIAHHIEEVIIEKELSIIAVVGERMRGIPGIAARVFQALGKSGANVVAIAQGSSELNISIVINQYDEVVALNAIHDVFFGKEVKTLHLFLVGPGLVGNKLLEQIRDQQKLLREEHAIELKVNGLTNSKKMLFDKNGINLKKDWFKQLADCETKADLAAFVGKMKELNFRNSVFVDCTASDATIPHYEKILRLGYSIVTPNKKANSSSYELYKNLKKVAFSRGAKIYYETNVGASLPIIHTINDMVASGDHILKIETIISGTISFIFNSFDGAKTFSQIVREAKENGYTEPDPRDDLNGLDVARKLLILAREAGLELEFADIKVQNLLPASCQQAKSVADFFVELEKQDGHFEKQRLSAAKESRKLRYIATLAEGKAHIALQTVDAAHPFYYLNRNENIIAITTNRYKETPLVIKGPGAGAEVTAAGVFADIIRLANA